MSDPIDAVKLTADLIRCPSVTPDEGGAIVLLERLLSGAEFRCTRIDRGGAANLFARWGKGGNGRTFGFNGHTDVVPAGDTDAWTVAPFGGEISDGVLYGRGATDMKSGVAAFAAAAIDLVRTTPPDGSIVLAITGDEEGIATDGTAAILDWMAANDEVMDHCLVGEPTCPERLGDMIKIGRRGSMNAEIVVAGKQGHSAYPDRALNPLPVMARLLVRLSDHELDQGSAHFDASSLVITNIDTGNTASNVIPAECRARLNIRFNDLHDGPSLSSWLKSEAGKIAGESGIAIDVATRISGESFLTEPGEFSDLVAAAVKAETGLVPELSTSGGTSDARFIKDHCPVVEFGLVGKTMHQVDECVPLAEIEALKAIYSRILRAYFAS